MKLLLDSADLAVLYPLLRTGAFVGVTTNPTILQKQGFSGDQLASFAADLFKKGVPEVFFQASQTQFHTLEASARSLAAIDKRIVVKLPCTREGLEVATALKGEGVRTCITAVYAAQQALLADAVGAAYVAPYLGRMNDARRNGYAMVAQMARMLKAAQSKTEILAASIRSLDDVAFLAENGAQAVTLPLKIAEAMLDDPLTIQATADFNAAAEAQRL